MKAFIDNIDFVRGKLSRAALFEQMAEEAAETSQAALKMARILRGENPTNILPEDAMQNLVEEISDFEVCKAALNMAGDRPTMLRKAKRWADRLMGDL